VTTAPEGGIVSTDESLPVAQSEAVNFLQLIERASRDPAVDIDKMERLMQMHREMMKIKAESEFNEALTACQRELGSVSADATNPQTKSRYATYAKLDHALRPIYTKHGISISYGTADSPKEEHVRVIAYAARGGYTRTYQVDMPADGKGAKGGDVMTKTHATGAAMQYGMRYLLKGIFNIAIGDEDKDGNTTRQMDERRKVELLEGIAATRDRKQAESLWQTIAAECAKLGDVATNNELRSAVTKHLKTLEAA
jgi:ERF superfamily